MIMDDIRSFQGLIGKEYTLLGLDLGTKTIGVAISDKSWTIALPLHTIRRTKFSSDIEQLTHIVEQRTVGGIVLGLPLNMNGTEGPRCQSTRAFAQNLNRKIDLPITFWDERLSTVAVERTLQETDTRHKRRIEIIDQMAAGFILQGLLDRFNLTNKRSEE